MSSFRLLDLMKPFGSIIPEIEISLGKSEFDDKIIYTFVSCFIYLLLQFPIVGVKVAEQLSIKDPFYWLRPIFGSEKGTLLEFGLLPILTSAFLWQLAAGNRLLNVNFTLKSDRALFQTLQKLTSVFLSFIYSIALVSSGYFDSSVGNPLSLTTAALIVAQITLTTLFVTLLVELIDKGYGFSSGVLSLLTIAIASNFAYNTIGIQVLKTARGFESVGSLVNLMKNIRTKPLGSAIISSFNRLNFSNLNQFYITIITFAIVMYLANFRFELTIKSTKVRSMSQSYPIKLLFCGSLPILFTFTVLYNLNIFGYAISRKMASNTLVKTFLADYDIISSSSIHYELTSGLLYYLSPSPIYNSIISKFLQTIIYSFFIITTSISFSKTWSSVSGSSGNDLSKTFKEQGISILGYRDSAITKELNKVIPTASITGAGILSLIVAFSELFGGYGLPVSVTVGITSGLTILESIMSEWQQNGDKNSSFAQVFNPNQ
ncbi:hypothetical protein PACTADRAFT_68595 [Pachysolen tannophilus NRRL Y-2460]|uniref:Translocon Sec61/SecY plug domain-containing protein n=1 Tax=Pachysolen tannophilus NRRL Y-2460 TaxID=669874 RepID=A0A1E4TUC5_PACTA|nr:hypothetical protein PACTADRAFT_68595 [Pachysolen tannophilus NRRL Y-2460]